MENEKGGRGRVRGRSVKRSFLYIILLKSLGSEETLREGGHTSYHRALMIFAKSADHCF